MNILITGSREWADREKIREMLSALPPGSVIHQGDCPSGADLLAKEEAKKLGFTVKGYPANWRRYGRRAGYIRNQGMFKESRPDEVWAFWLNDSRGTKNMIDIATRGKARVVITKRRTVYRGRVRMYDIFLLEDYTDDGKGNITIKKEALVEGEWKTRKSAEERAAHLAKETGERYTVRFNLEYIRRFW